MHLILLSQRVSDCDFMDSSTCFFKISQRWAEEENSTYNLVSTPKNVNASVDELALSTTTKLRVWFAQGT